MINIAYADEMIRKSKRRALGAVFVSFGFWLLLGAGLLAIDCLGFIFYLAVTVAFVLLYVLWPVLETEDAAELLFCFRQDLIQNETEAQERDLLDFWQRLQKVAGKAGVSCRRVLVSEGIRAQAAVIPDLGLDLLAVTERSIRILKPEEMEAVLAHEFGHIIGGEWWHKMYLLVRSTAAACQVLSAILLAVMAFAGAMRWLAFVSYPVGYWFLAGACFFALVAGRFCGPRLEAFVLRQGEVAADMLSAKITEDTRLKDALRALEEDDGSDTAGASGNGNYRERHSHPSLETRLAYLSKL